ncbi:unnamed protein product, partial [Polarella glacialis]
AVAGVVAWRSSCRGGQLLFVPSPGSVGLQTELGRTPSLQWAAAPWALSLGPSPAWAADAVASSGGDWFDPVVNLNSQLILAIDSVVGSAGVAIILYTVLLKALTYPLTQPALRTNAALQLASPQVDLIKRKYSEDEDAQNKTLRLLYEEIGVNPLAAIVPVLVQLPIFIGLFRAIGRLAAQDDHFKEAFLWIPSLSGPVASGQPTLDWLIKTQSADHFEPLIGWHDASLYCVMPIIVLASQLLTQKVNASSQESSFQQVIPAFIFISTLVSPSAIGVYFLVNNLLATAQMKVIQ